MAHAPPETTRFAPSPTGLLHIGHAYAAILAHDMARKTGGRFLVRIEDIDAGRCRPEYEKQILDDLRWLGLAWDGPVRRQSEHLALYREALDALTRRGLTYPCFCTRKDIAAEVARLASAPHGAEGPLYPGTCRRLDEKGRARRLAEATPAWRLDSARAHAQAARKGAALTFVETGCGPGGESGLITTDPGLLGDIVLGRKDYGVSYHLAVTLDDHAQGVTRVTRGEDLFPSTHVQRLLQALLDLETPRYFHHRLIRDENGRRLAKRDRDRTLVHLRDEGATPHDIRALVGLTNP